jgi:hypothetical protein
LWPGNKGVARKKHRPIELRISHFGVFFFSPHSAINNPRLRRPARPGAVWLGTWASAIGGLLAAIPLIFGALGYLMVKTGFPLAPLILGVILGDQIETNYVRAVMTDSDWTLFFTRPWSGAMMALSVISFVYSLWQRQRALKRAGKPSEEAEGEVEF